MLLELQNIQKRFGGVTALRDGNLAVAAGEVHLLLGENGAGKSTLMKIVAGIVERDSGRMLWNGDEVQLRTPSEAAAIGIAMVNQESLLAPHMTVAENIFLGREERRAFGWVDRGAIVTRARRLIEQYQFPLDAEGRVDRLSPAGRQLVEICRAIQHGVIKQGSSLLIFDEPTSSLSDTETQQVFRIVRDLKARGMGIIYITHRMDELRAIGDRVTVLRDGATVHTGNLADIETGRLIQYMVGREVAAIYQREHLEPGAPMLEVRDISVKRSRLENISLTLRKGEITGMAGLIGAGRTELCRAMFGVDPIDSGEILVNGSPARIASPRDAVKAGIALVTEDRQISGLALRLPIATNITMANVERISRFGFLRLAMQNREASELGSRLRLKAASTAQLAGTPQRRQPAEGGDRQMAVSPGEDLPVRRAHARHRHRRESGGVRAYERTGAPGRGDPDGEFRAAGTAACGRPHRGDAAGPHLGRAPAQHNSGTDHETGSHGKRRMKFDARVTQRLLPFLSLIVLFVALSIASPYFLTANNLASVARQTAVFNTMALGMTIIIISGGIDLSVGSILGLSGLIGTMALERGYPIVVSVLIGMAVGMLCGFCNGLMVTQLRIPPFVVTLGTLGIFRGLALIFSNGLPVHRIPPGFAFLGEGNVLGVPFVVWMLVICAVAVHVVLEHTRLGRYAFAIGSNRIASIYAGIPVNFHITAVYAIGGALTGLAGMIEASRLMTGQPTAGQGYELQAIAAVVIGGGSLNGGEGSVVGTLIGAFIMGLLSNGADLLNISNYWQQVIIGAVIILAVTLDEVRKRRAVVKNRENQATIVRNAPVDVCLLSRWLVFGQEPKLVSLSGVVVNSATGEPVKRALVQINQAVWQQDATDVIGDVDTGPQAKVRKPVTRTAFTDVSGIFRFDGIPEGKYGFTVQKPQFTLAPGTDLLDAPSESVRLSLSPLGVITGRVVDQDGLPLRGVNVYALSSRIQEGLRVTATDRDVTTDDRGMYRLWNLSPGSYLVKASGFSASTVTYIGDTSPATLGESFPTTYFGGGKARDSATPIEIRPGTEAVADLTLNVGRAFSIRGRLANIAPREPVKFELLTNDDPSPVRVTLNKETGKFEVAAVSPGTYTLRVTQDKAIAELPLNMPNSDLEGVAMTLEPPVDVPVNIRFTNEPEKIEVRGHQIQLPAVCTISLRSPDDDTDDPIYNPKSNNIPGVVPGRYRVVSQCAWRLRALDPLWLSGSIVESRRPDRVRILDTDRDLGDIRPRKPHRRRRRLSQPTGVADPYPRLAGDPVEMTVQAQQFQVPNLAPGAWTVYAFSNGEEIEYLNREFVRTLTGGVPAEIEAGKETKITIPGVVR